MESGQWKRLSASSHASGIWRLVSSRVSVARPYYFHCPLSSFRCSMPPPPSPSPSLQAAHPVVVTAMGRHPGWPNTIDQFGRINATAHMARRVVFEHGLFLAAARGVWDKVPEARRVDGLTHDVLWLAPSGEGRSQAGVVARCWMSRDSSGRVGPMMVMASVENAPVSWVAEQALPRLVAVEKMCRETNSPELVRLSVGEAQHQVEDTLAMLVGAAKPGEADESVLSELAHATWGEGPTREEQCARLVHAVRGGTTHLRVPKVLEGSRAVRAWGIVAQRLAGGSKAVLIMARDRAGYLDVFLAGPDAQALTVLRADESHTPISTLSGDAPTDDDRKEALALLRSLAAGPAPTPRRRSTDKQPSRRRGLVMLIAGGVLVGGLATWLVVSRGKDAARKQSEAGDPAPLVMDSKRPVAPERGNEHPAPDATTYLREILPEKLDTIDSRVAALADELRAQGVPVRDDLAARAAAVRQRFEKGEPAEKVAAQADELRRQVDALHGEAAGRVLTYLKEQASSPPAELPPDAREAWASRMLKIAPREGMARAKREVAKVRSDMVESAKSITRAYDFEIPATAPVDVNALRAARNTHRERALRQPMPAPRDPWPEAARSAVEAATNVDEALRGGKVLDEEHRGRPVREWGERLREAAEDPEIGAAVASVVNKVRALERVDTLEKPDALLASMDGADTSRVSEVRAAVRRLATHAWPLKADDFATLARLRSGVVAPAISAVQDAGARARVQEAVDADIRKVWRTGVERAVRSDADLRAAMGVMEGLGVGDADVALLPEWAQFSMARARFSDAVEGGDNDAARSAASAFFVEGIQKDRVWPALQSKHPRIDVLADAARRFCAPDRYPSLATLGPGSLGWELTQDGDGVLTYTSPDGVRASFTPPEKKASPTPSQRVAYLSTTEFSVAQASAVVRDPKWTDTLRGALPDYRLDNSDPRAGVRTWGWVKTSKGWDIKPPANNPMGGWQRVASSVKGEHAAFAPGVNPSAVSDDAPMQSISPQGAAALAAAMGCRLATVAEWKSAASGVDANAGNLRDTQFSRQAEWVRAKGAAAGVAPPATDIFYPANSQRTAAVEDVVSVISADDGVLWFDAAVQHGQFLNLVGNVSEYVVGDATGFVEGAILSPEALATSGVLVIGGSALSIGYPTLEGQAVDGARAASGYADVGFRVAFSAPSGAKVVSPEQEVRDALARQPAVYPPK